MQQTNLRHSETFCEAYPSEENLGKTKTLKVQAGPQKEVGGGQSRAKDDEGIVPQPGLLSLSPLPLQDFAG